MKKSPKSTKRQRDRGISLWVSAAEAEQIKRAAALLDIPMSAWVRRVALAKAAESVA